MGHTNTKDVSLHGDTHTQGSDIQQQKSLSLLAASMVGQDRSLNSRSIRNTLIWINRLVQGASTENIRHKFLNLWNSRRPTHQNNIINLILINLCVLENTFHRGNSLLKDFIVDSLESGSRDGRSEILTLVKRVDFNFGLCDARQRSLGTFAGRTKTTLSTGIAR